MARSWKTAVMICVVVPMCGMASSSGGFFGACHQQAGRLASDQDARAEWSVYRNDEYGFQVKYPADFELAETPDALVANGAVITFVPAYNPSINERGDETNLISFSVTIGVSESRGVTGQETERSRVNDRGRRSRGFCPRRIRFVRSGSSEGAVGNRYERSVFSIDLAGRCYEIVLFVHSANPGCYAAGTVTLFDSTRITQLFETMVSTFSLSVGTPYR